MFTNSKCCAKIVLLVFLFFGLSEPKYFVAHVLPEVHVNSVLMIFIRLLVLIGLHWIVFFT